MRQNEYNTMKISKERKNLRNKINDSQIRITSDKVCMRDSEICRHNSGRMCYECAVFLGSEDLKILFDSLPTVSDVDELDQQIRRPVQEPNLKYENLIKPPLSEEPKVPSPTEEVDDIPHFIKRICKPIITHAHTKNSKLHNHFFTDNIFLNNYCFLCGIPTVGNTSCGQCALMLDIE
jgi:hypothetical protein